MHRFPINTMQRLDVPYDYHTLDAYIGEDEQHLNAIVSAGFRDYLDKMLQQPRLYGIPPTHHTNSFLLGQYSDVTARHCPAIDLGSLERSNVVAAGPPEPAYTYSAVPLQERHNSHASVVSSSRSSEDASPTTPEFITTNAVSSSSPVRRTSEHHTPLVEPELTNLLKRRRDEEEYYYSQPWSEALPQPDIASFKAAHQKMWDHEAREAPRREERRRLREGQPTSKGSDKITWEKDFPGVMPQGRVLLALRGRAEPVTPRPRGVPAARQRSERSAMVRKIIALCYGTELHRNINNTFLHAEKDALEKARAAPKPGEDFNCSPPKLVFDEKELKSLEEYDEACRLFSNHPELSLEAIMLTRTQAYCIQ